MSAPAVLETIDPIAFRRVLSQFATGVTIITVEHNDEVHGMTANSFTALSLDPPLVLFCVAKTARMAAFVEQADGFAVSILSASQESISRQFAGPSKREAALNVEMDATAVAPIIHRPLAALSCTIETLYEGGDHWIVVGRVVGLHEPMGMASQSPLVFFRSRYAHVVERDLDARRPAETWTNDAIRIYHDEWTTGEESQIDEREAPW